MSDPDPLYDGPYWEGVALGCPPGYKLVAISLEPDWVCLEGMNQRELDAYDYGSSSFMAAMTRVLDGKDDGHGIANEPWESMRRRVLALMANQRIEPRPISDD